MPYLPLIEESSILVNYCKFSNLIHDPQNWSMTILEMGEDMQKGCVDLDSSTSSPGFGKGMNLWKIRRMMDTTNV